MKIAIVVNTSWNIYNFRMGLAKSLLARGHEVFAVAPRDHYSKAIQESGCHYIDLKMDSRGVNPLKDMGLIMELYGIYKKIRPEIVLHFTIKPNIYGTLAARMLNIPVINNVCGLGTIFLTKSLASRIAVLMYRIAFRFPKKIIFQNPDDMNLFIGKKLVKQEQCQLLPGSGINLEKFKPSISDKNNKFTFLLISRLILDKGILEYVEAIRILKEKGIDAEFQLLGNPDPDHKRGIPLKTINEWIDNKLVEYKGSSDDVASFIKKADCVVLPSYREGVPRSLLEAASLAKPIIASDVPGCNRVVIDQVNGLLCKPRNPGDLAVKMESMINMNEETLQEMGSRGRKLIEDVFDEKFVIDIYNNQIEKVAGLN